MQSVLLVIHIAHTEDAARYSGPVRFWNGQLMETLGFSSPKQLSNARDKAVEAGWLVYERQTNRSVGRYYTAIPNRFTDISDAPIEEPECSLSKPVPDAAIIPAEERMAERVAERKGDELRNDKVTNCGTKSGKPSIPIPIPLPLPNPNTHTHIRAAFENFLESIFKRTGQRVDEIRRETMWIEVLRRDHALEDIEFSILKGAKSLLRATDDWQKIKADSMRASSGAGPPGMATSKQNQQRSRSEEIKRMLDEKLGST